jgi:RNA polymerase sigma-B factor
MLAAGARSQAETSEMRELVRAALDVLDPRERRIVALRYYRDWSQQRIAAEVGLSQVQVSRVLSASLAKMRNRLEAA